MTKTAARYLLASLFLAVAACGSSSNDCSSSQVTVAYLGGASDGKMECKPIPTACGTTAACSVQACISALYDLCATPYIGVGCSDTVAPTIVSCNP